MNSSTSTQGQDISCGEVLRLVTDYLDGAMSESDRERFAAHLEACDGCEGYLKQIQATIRVTGHLPPERIPPEVRERLLDAFREWKAGPAPTEGNGSLGRKLREFFRR